tara:strand:+ start:4870 stop:5136 length:267 start_codon:yes stop_codon:yes gene_type:complete
MNWEGILKAKGKRTAKQKRDERAAKSRLEQKEYAERKRKEELESALIELMEEGLISEERVKKKGSAFEISIWNKTMEKQIHEKYVKRE